MYAYKFCFNSQIPFYFREIIKEITKYYRMNFTLEVSAIKYNKNKEVITYAYIK